MKKLTVKPDWRVMRKRFILVCMIPFLVTVLILIACIFSRRTEIQSAPFELPLFGLVIDFFLIGLFYLKNSPYSFPCNLFAEKDLDGLLEILTREHGIKNMKT